MRNQSKSSQSEFVFTVNIYVKLFSMFCIMFEEAVCLKI